MSKKEYQKRYYQENRDKLTQYSRDWYKSNKSHVKRLAQARYLRNREHRKAYSKAYYVNHRDEIRAFKSTDRYKALCKQWRSKPNSHHSRRLYKYGITAEQYQKMNENQKGVCAICLGNEIQKDRWTGKVINLAIDHCHSTNKVRGLLCRRCNNVLGLMKDDPSILRNAAAYISLHSMNHVIT